VPLDGVHKIDCSRGVDASISPACRSHLDGHAYLLLDRAAVRRRWARATIFLAALVMCSDGATERWVVAMPTIKLVNLVTVSSRPGTVRP